MIAAERAASSQQDHHSLAPSPAECPLSSSGCVDLPVAMVGRVRPHRAPGVYLGSSGQCEEQSQATTRDRRSQS